MKISFTFHQVLLIIGMALLGCSQPIKDDSIHLEITEGKVEIVIDSINKNIFIHLKDEYHPAVAGNYISLRNGDKLVDLPSDLTEPQIVELAEKTFAVTYNVMAVYASSSYRIKLDPNRPNEMDIVVPMKSVDYCPIAYSGNIYPIEGMDTNSFVVDLNECADKNSIKFFIIPSSKDENLEGEYEIKPYNKDVGLVFTFFREFQGMGQSSGAVDGKIVITNHDQKIGIISGYIQNVSFSKNKNTAPQYIVEGVFNNVPIKK